MVPCMCMAGEAARHDPNLGAARGGGVIAVLRRPFRGSLIVERANIPVAWQTYPNFAFAEL